MAKQKHEKSDNEIKRSGLPAFDNPRGWQRGNKLPKTAGQKAEERKKAIEQAVKAKNEKRCDSEITRNKRKRRCDFDKGHFGTTHKSVVTVDGKTSCVYWDTRTKELWFEDYEEGKLL